jgi:outer membrane cobalamin receptor
MFYVFLILFSFADDALAPKQYIFANRDSEEFSERTLHSPYTEIKPNPTLLTNASFENVFLGNTSIQARTQGSPSVSLRGSAQAARVLFVLDEIPLNFADGFGGTSLFVPIEITDTINIIEGPISSQYGANAMAGAIHFKTKQQSSPLVRVGVGDADNGLLKDSQTLSTANVALITPYVISENHKVQASVFLENDRGDFKFDNSNGSQKRQNNSQNLRRFTFSSKHKFGDVDVKTLSFYTGLNKLSPGPLNSPFVTSQSSNALFTAVSARVKGEHQSAKTTFSYSSLESDYLDPAATASNSKKYFLSQNYARELSAQLLSLTTLDVHHNLYSATFVGDETFDRTEPEIAQTLVYEPTSNLAIEPTIRYLSRYKEWTGQLNIPYRLTSSRLWLNIGQGFRPPSLTDLYAQTVFFVGNRELRPEKSLQGEVGIGWDFPLFSLTSSLYHTRYKDLFQSISASPGVLSKVNVGQAETTGFNSGVVMNYQNYSLRVSDSIMFAREVPTNSPLLLSPNNQFFAALTYQKQRWSFTAQHTHWSSFYDFNFNTAQKVKLPEWDGTDLLISFRTQRKVSVSLGLFNIFDHARQLSFDFPEPQRRVFLSLEIPL